MAKAKQNNKSIDELMQEAIIPSEKVPYKVPDNWCWVNLLDISNISTGKKNANHAKKGGKYRFYTCSSQFTFCDTKSFSGESIIIPGNGDIGLVFYYEGEFEAYQRTYVISSFQGIAKYL